jgi:dTDP-4-dehydrorhamnose 3,5-epimerase
VSRFTVEATPLAGLQVVTRQRLGDARGSLSRLFCADELREAGWALPIAQINHTVTSRAGTLRGLHFQHPPHAEIKLVSCLRGEVYDVAVDLRAGSPTFLQWHAQRLSADNGRALLIPRGFAHGFQSLTDDVELLYCHSAAYAAAAEGGLNPHDARLSIDWPLAVTEISARDQAHPRLSDDFQGVTV